MIVRTTAALCAAVLATAAAAPAAETKPLRTLTYDVSLSVVSSVTSRNNGLGAGGGDVSSAPGFEEHGFGSAETGTVRVDVIAATADGGLVVDASYQGTTSTNGNTTKQAPIRVAITSDGRLGYDPKTALQAQVAELLPMLARGIVADRAAAAGATWAIAAPEPAAGTITFRVTSTNGTLATIAVSEDASVGGAQGFDEHQEGTLTYQPSLATPVRWDTRIRLRRRGLRGGEVNDIHLTASLASDTFVKKPST